MYYTTSGKGKVVVLIHGFVEEGNMWCDVAKALSKSYKVIVPDLPGFGKSEISNSKSEISMQYYTEEIFSVLKKEKVKQCVMLGHSMGGYITLHFAEKYPKLLSGFGLINSHCFEDSDEKKANRKKSNAFIAKHGTDIFVKELTNNIFHDSYKKKHPKVIEQFIQQGLGYSPEAVIAVSEAMMKRKDKSTVMKNAEVPVLLICGKEDAVVPLELSLKQASYAAVTDFHLFDNSKHMTVFEKKKESLAAIMGYLSFI